MVGTELAPISEMSRLPLLVVFPLCSIFDFSGGLEWPAAGFISNRRIAPPVFLYFSMLRKNQIPIYGRNPPLCGKT
jgi:hypothetical protein